MSAAMKIIGVIIFVFMILLVVNYRSFLPYVDRLAVGSNAPSPFQVGSSYIDQIDQMSPYKQYGSLSGSGQTSFAEFKAAQQGVKTGSAQEPVRQYVVKKGKITVQKNGDVLRMVSEYVPVPKENPKAHIWIANRPTITKDTYYLDFGQIKSGDGMQVYTLQVGDPKVSFDEYKYVMIINTEDLTIYGQSVLGK